MSTSDAIWRDDGHLTAEAALAAGDGQAADAAVAAHIQACDQCLRAVGLAARRSLQVDELLRLGARVDPDLRLVARVDPELRLASRVTQQRPLAAPVDPQFPLVLRRDPEPRPGDRRAETRARTPSRRWAIAAAALVIGAFAAGRLSALGNNGGPLPEPETYRPTARLQLDRHLTALATGAAVPPMGDLRLQLDAAGEPHRSRGGCPVGGLLQ